MHYIYWIKKKDHSDILSEGYIGYSNNPKRRFEEHKKSNSRLGNSIRKYRDSIDLIVLHKFDSEEQALKKEKELRPKPKIGWNIAQGGQCPPDIKNDLLTRQKISNTLKQKGITPYCKKTHSKETIKKANQTKKEKRYRAFYNPITLEWKMFSLAEENVPANWISGRKPKTINKPKVRGIDYVCNAKTWKIYKNEELICKTDNLKKWCFDNNVDYFAGSKTNSIRVLKDTKTYTLKKSNDNTIIENGTDTKLSSKEYANFIKKSPAYVSTSLKKGFYKIKTYDVYKYEKVIQSKDRKDND